MDNKEINLGIGDFNYNRLVSLATGSVYGIVGKQGKINGYLNSIHRTVGRITSDNWKGTRANEFIKTWNDTKDGIIQVCTNFINNSAVTLYRIARNYSDVDMMSLDKFKFTEEKLSLDNIELTNDTGVEFKDSNGAQRSMKKIGEDFGNIITVFRQWSNDDLKGRTNFWNSTSGKEFKSKVDTLIDKMEYEYLAPIFEEMKSKLDDAITEYSNIK